jgi:uncharacterized repeat protein (TIGR04138 family)
MQDFDSALEAVVTRDPRYHRDAYHFVREALDHTQGLYTKSGHVTGRELLEGIRDYALKQYGPMALLVLEEWGLRRCEDFGDIVFNLIDAQILKKTDRDTREEFAGGYDFAEAFRKPFEPGSAVRG